MTEERCHVIDVDGQPVSVHGAGQLSDTTAAAVAALEDDGDAPTQVASRDPHPTPDDLNAAIATLYEYTAGQDTEEGQ